VIRRLLAVALLCSAVACSNGDSTAPPTELTVFAASSLTTAFTQIGSDFQRSRPGVIVAFTFGSSTDLAGRIEGDGVADVFASASGTAMDTIAASPGVGERTAFATNTLAIITPPDNPADVTSLDSLTRPTVQLALGAEGVPIGDYARQMLQDEGILHPVLSSVVSFEPDDASIVAKVVSGEADAGIVYASDVVAAGAAVHSVSLPPAVNVTVTYPIAVVTGSKNAPAAGAFLDYVIGPEGQATLASFGFEPPPNG
jgi:molybdate transport system substrate-binding protein